MNRRKTFDIITDTTNKTNEVVLVKARKGSDEPRYPPNVLTRRSYPTERTTENQPRFFTYRLFLFLLRPCDLTSLVVVHDSTSQA